MERYRLEMNDYQLRLARHRLQRGMKKVRLTVPAEQLLAVTTVDAASRGPSTAGGVDGLGPFDPFMGSLDYCSRLAHNN